MPAWPSTLPQLPLVAGYSEQVQSQVLRSTMDAGPAKSRRRFTAASRTIPVRYLLTEEQTHFFEDWFEIDLAGGSLPFDWVPGRQRSAVSAVIVGDPPYTLTPAGGEWWQLAFSVEVQP